MPTHPQAVVTGAASGIGAAFARHAANRGYALLLADRDTTRLDALAQELRTHHTADIQTVAADLATPAGMDALAAAIAALPRVDLLINSAGLTVPKPFIETPLADLRPLVDVHCQALTVLCHAAALRMAAQGSGAIINVASLGALVEVGVGAVYGASKSYVVRFSRSLHRELRASGVYVQALCPGHTRTNLHSAEELRWTPSIFFTDAESVVRASWRAWERRRAVCIPGWRHRLLWLLARAGLGRLTWLVALKGERAWRRLRPPAAQD